MTAFVSTYNAGSFLAPAIDSVLGQTHEDFELLVVDDGSTDGSTGFLDSIEDPRMRVVHQENQGLGSPLNRWLRAARGEYIMRFDADDLCAPQRMDEQLTFLEDHPEVILVGCQMRFFSDRGMGHATNLFPDHDRIVEGMLRGWHTMSHATIMFRKSLLERMEGYTVSGPGEDWSFILDAARHGRLAVLPSILYFVRLHPSSNAWRGAERSLAGLRYAQKRHRLFLSEGRDFTFEEFQREWQDRNRLQRLATRAGSSSSVLFRKAILNRIGGRVVLWGLQMLLASLLEPNKTLGALRKIFQSRRLGQPFTTSSTRPGRPEPDRSRGEPATGESPE